MFQMIQGSRPQTTWYSLRRSQWQNIISHVPVDLPDMSGIAGCQVGILLTRDGDRGMALVP